VKIALFDFDGTLTERDSLLDFLRFTLPPRRFWPGAARLFPVMCAYKFGLMANDKAKMAVLSQFFRGMSEQEFLRLAQSYAKGRIPAILRSRASERLAWHCEQGHEVVIVSASPAEWLRPWADPLGLRVIATGMEVRDGCITGRFSPPNCHGEEKVRRIRAEYDLSAFDTIYAYGDTAGDRPMLALAHEAHYRPFR